MTITEFLLARIAEDEERASTVAWAMLPNEGSTASIVLDHPGLATGDNPGFVTSYDPARVLADCMARRALIQIVEQSLQPLEAAEVAAANPGVSVDSAAGQAALLGYNEGVRFASEQVLVILAAAYADHEDFQKEWVSGEANDSR